MKIISLKHARAAAFAVFLAAYGFVPDAAGLAQALSFGKAKNFTVGTNPVFVVAGDFNNDSKVDLAVVNNINNSVSILLGDGAGGFTIPLASFPVGMSPLGAAVGDFDEDGNLDLAVANFADNKVSILLGNGDGTFDAAVNFAVGTGPIFISVGNFNDSTDGHLDLAVANHGSHDVSILLGDGSGGFTAVTPTTQVGIQPVSIAVGNFNNDIDSHPDLAVANFVDNTVSILLGNGDGTFTQPADCDATTPGTSPTCIVGTQPVSIVTGDFNNDGVADLAVANEVTNNVSILLGNADTTAGLFKAAQNFSLGKIPVSLTVADFNGDGALDLAAAHFPGKQLSVILGNGDGTFGTPKSFKTVAGQFAITNGDFDGDTKPDLAVVNGTLSVLLNTTAFASAGAFDPAANISVSAGPSSVAVGDFNRNGKLDLAVTNSGDDKVSILLGAGNGTFSAASGSPVSVGDQPSSVAVGDFNRDGKLDLAVANFGDDNVSVLLSNGDGTFSAASGSPVSVGDQPSSVAVGDFNRDGKLDLAVANFGDDNVSVLLSNGDGTFDAAVNFAAGTAPSSLAVGDFNRDGNLDLGVANSGSNNVSILLGNGTGGFTAATPSTLAVGTGPSSVAVGDFNQDGKLDLVVANQTSDNVSILLNAPGLIHVTTPNGGETWTIGSTQTIQWSSQGITGNVKIDLSSDGGTTWKNIVKSTADTGSRTWKVAKPPAPTARIRVCGVTFPAICDTSDANFTIN